MHNNYEKNCFPQFPISQAFRERLGRDVSYPVLWRVSLLDGVQLSHVFDAVVRQPLLSKLNERTKVQVSTNNKY